MTTHASIAHDREGRRGFAMGLAIITVAVLFFAAIVVLQFVTNSASNSSSVQFKQAAFDAAEAGLNDGIRALDVSLGGTATGYVSPSTTLTNTGASYTWTMVNNNLSGPGSVSAGGLTVPAHTAYIKSTGSLPGNRTEIVGAIIGRATGLKAPGGAIDAAANIFDDSHAPILQSASNTPADVHANGNITVGGSPGTVQGSTYAAGSTNQWTTANASYSNQVPVTFPTSQMDTALANTALGLAKSGTTISGSNPVGTYTGNVYVNGPINLGGGTVQFNGGGTVYINGNVTISGHGSIVNQNGSLIVVNGTFASSGQSPLVVPLGSGGQLMVLASDPNPVTCAAGGGGCAVTMGGSSSAVGMIFAPFGSVQMSGNGTLTGALAAGVDIVFIGGGARGAFQYDDNAGNPPITASNYKAFSYIEN